MAAQVSETRSIWIIGLANSGKTQLFNHLTGDYRLVANYPMTTMELAEGSYVFRGTRWITVDTPGLSALSCSSAEELLLRRTLAVDRPDVILQCIDANRIRQSLRLTAELLELGIPMVLSLNAIDETAKKGLSIDADRLSGLLGIPVVKTSAREGVGLYDLKEALTQAAVPRITVEYEQEIESALSRLEQALPPQVTGGRRYALYLLLGDPYLFSIELSLEAPERMRLERLRDKAVGSLRGDLRTRISRQLAAWTDMIYEKIVTARHVPVSRDVAARAAYYSRHPVWGLLFLGAFLLISYIGVVEVAGTLTAFLERAVTEPAVSLIRANLSSQFFTELLIGEFGLLTLGLFNAVLTVLPILSVFFFIFGVMEDIGYLPNLSVLLRRGFTKIGLSGRAVMPMVLGFGCKTMATLTTRTLPSRKERLIAIYLIAFAIPCSPQLALNIAILGRAGIIPFLTAGIFLVVVEIAAGKVLNFVITDDGESYFIQELPPFRLPLLREVVRKTRYRLWWFLREAVPVFVGAAAAIFLFDLIGLLDMIKQVLRPIVVTWMGLPIEMVEALILLIAREEAAAGLILRLSNAGGLTALQSIIAVVVTTMFVPCFANVVAMFKEAGIRAGILMLLAINVSTILFAGLLYRMLLPLQHLF